TVDETFHKDLEFAGRGTEVEDAAAVEPDDTVGSFQVAVDVNGLVEIELTIVAPAQRMQDVVRVLGAEPGQHHAAAVGFAVHVRVLEMEKLGALADIDASVARLDTGGDEQPIGEYRGFVGLPVAVRVFENEDLVVGDLAG